LDGKLPVNGDEVTVSSRVVQYKLSAHAGQKELREYVSRRGDKGVVVAIHGDPAATEAFARWITENTGYTGLNPSMGEWIKC
jgi:Cft2 family RNA processing exonuclease